MLIPARQHFLFLISKLVDVSSMLQSCENSFVNTHPANTWRLPLSVEGISLLPPYEGSLPHVSDFSEENIHALHCILSATSKSSIQTRSRLYVTRNRIISGSDYGFLEIFNPHLLPSSFPLYLNLSDLSKYLTSLGITSMPSYISYYVYDGICLPRRLHHDTSYNSFKIFIAISDIHDLSQGPYVYVRKSHLRKRYRLSDLISHFNILKTGGDGYDAAWIEWDNMFYGYIHRSHCFISNQRGIHGDLPAHPSKKKIVLAICFNERCLSGLV